MDDLDSIAHHWIRSIIWHGRNNGQISSYVTNADGSVPDGGYFMVSYCSGMLPVKAVFEL